MDLPPPAWAGQNAWRILDTGFNTVRLLGTWQAWRLDAQRPRLLHYVAFSPQPPTVAELQQAAAAFPELQPLAQELGAQWHGLLSGFHRLSLQQGHLLLTLCVGETQALLREQQFEADSVLLDAETYLDRWTAKALARCCRRGTTLSSASLTSAQSDVLAQCGFEIQGSQGRFHPRWELKNTRDPLRTRAVTPGHCAVIGAGLAGASVAAALARRGWQVQVLDAAPHPAAGASGLPVGLVVPHVSADDSPRSRLSRAGVRLMLQELQRLLPCGQDWDASGVLEHRVDGTPGLPSLWHAQAGWVKPARLIEAWLAQSGVRFVANAAVASLRRDGAAWLLLDAAGQTLATASHVVLANAGDAPRLLRQLRTDMPTWQARIDLLPAVHGMRGVLSWGMQPAGAAAALPPYPVNGLGSLIPGVPLADGLAWYAGATYESIEQVAAPEAAHHQLNRDKLHTLLPEAAKVLDPVFVSGQVRSWSGTRCVSTDRLPLVGPLDHGDSPTLWLSTALGSRGLSLSLLCAELIAARLGAEPWPVEVSLARSLHATRPGSRL